MFKRTNFVNPFETMTSLEFQILIFLHIVHLVIMVWISPWAPGRIESQSGPFIWSDWYSISQNDLQLPDAAIIICSPGFGLKELWRAVVMQLGIP